MLKKTDVKPRWHHIDAEGRVLPPGEVGDIALHGRPPSLFLGYWQDEAASAACRRGELGAARFEDLDLKGRTLLLRGASTKSRRSRTVALDADADRGVLAQERRRHPFRPE